MRFSSWVVYCLFAFPSSFLFLFSTRMAARRVALKAVDWLAFAELVPPNQRGMFNALKTRSDAIAAKSVLQSSLHL